MSELERLRGEIEGLKGLIVYLMLDKASNGVPVTQGPCIEKAWDLVRSYTEKERKCER